MGRGSNPFTQSSVFNVLWFFSGLFPLPIATMYLVSHMESIKRGHSLLQALASCCSEASQTTSLILRTKTCSLLQRQAVTGPGTQPGFPEPQPSMEASFAARPAMAGGGKGGRATARRGKSKHRELQQSRETSLDGSQPACAGAFALHSSALLEPMDYQEPWHACAGHGYGPQTGATADIPCQLLKCCELRINLVKFQ